MSDIIWPERALLPDSLRPLALIARLGVPNATCMATLCYARITALTLRPGSKVAYLSTLDHG